MAALDQRSATLDLSEPCARCGAALQEPPPLASGPFGGAMPEFYLFPTGNAFHGSCLCSEVLQFCSAPQRARIKHVQEALSKVGGTSCLCRALSA
jgi:vacuolar protein sorting-associated protein 18